MPLNIFKKKPKRACVIGLDGVPYTLIQQMMKQGVMPHTRDIVARGAMRAMTVTLPEISSVSWSTFMTAKNPGEHGIFGFTDLKPASYSIRFPSFRDLKAPTIWDMLGKQGMKSVVINQPSTYPARPIPGTLISGFVSIELEKSVTPISYYHTLQKNKYAVDIDTQECAGNPPKLFKALDELLQGRKRIMDDLWERDNWNFFEVVVTGTDRLHHFMWDAVEDENHQYHNAFLDYYRAVDDFIHYTYTLFQSMGESDNFFILSDHGFCRTRNEFYVNYVLEKEGFLSLPAGGTLDQINEKTKAFALDPARIYINTKGKFPKGGVKDEDVAHIISDLKSVFGELTHNGKKIVRHAFDNEEAYSGPLASVGPDLLLVPHNGFDFKGRISAETAIGERKLQGMHTWDNAFFFSLDAGVFEGDGGTLDSSVFERNGGSGGAGVPGNAVSSGGMTNADGSNRRKDSNVPVSDGGLAIVDVPKKILRKLDVEI